MKSRNENPKTDAMPETKSGSSVSKDILNRLKAPASSYKFMMNHAIKLAKKPTVETQNLVKVDSVLPNISSLKSTDQTVETLPATHSVLNADSLKTAAWQLTNFLTVATLTNAAIVSVQSPLKSVLVSLSKNGTFLPTNSYGVLSIFKALYAGTSASLSNSALRTVYSTSVRESKLVTEETAEIAGASKKPMPMNLQTLSFVSRAALGDVMLTQISESLSLLRKVPGLLPKDFNWKTMHNASSLMLGGIVPRYASGMVNFAALTALEEKIAETLPFEDKRFNHTLSGVLSGALAAVGSYPLNAFKDYTLVRATVNNGKLINKSSFAVIGEMYQALIEDPSKAVGAFSKNAVKQLPVRMISSALIFSIISGLGATLGSEPLENVVPESFKPNKLPPTGSNGFFKVAKANSPVVQEVNSKDSENKASKAM